MLKGLQHPNIVRFYDFWEVKKQDDSKKTAQSNVQDHSMRLKGKFKILGNNSDLVQKKTVNIEPRFRAVINAGFCYFQEDEVL